jgi:predicted nucleotide-binding protein (sugar kinase/HSP70/actin superfamily)
MIKIKDIVDDTFTNASGYVLYLALDDKLKKTSEVFDLSFEGISCTSSSFLNSSIGIIIEDYGIDVLKRIKPIHVGATQADLLKKYISSALKTTKN